jgi:hypothetical protein
VSGSLSVLPPLFNNYKHIKYQKGQLVSSGGSTYDATVTILDSTEEGYTIEWKYSNIKLKNPSENPFVKSLVEMSKGVTAKYKTDELGAFAELLNWKEMQEFIFKAIDKIIQEFNNPQITAAINQVKNIYISKESIEQTAIKEIQLYHSPYGGEYQLNEVIKTETQLPNFLGGEPFPAILTIEMTKLKPEENYCKIQMLQSIDKERATKIIFDFVKKIAKESGKPEPTERDLPLITINDVSEFEVELTSGWLTRAYYKREVQSNDIKQIDTYEIKLRQ